ncbi:multiple epidermal growth factor-like domains protein 10, partial [Saccostrea cucullata]|uniref:multiple epidermal growth factor-like domains protein 10 n=1 Tax=Saccostrea cuccullata TaxID=36930 RepID=UPI002ED66AB3
MAFLCRYLLGVVMLSFQAQLIKRKFCGDTNEGIERCCTDYKYVPGTCEPCYGSFGIDCVNPCSDGFYGHGCKMKCNCSSFELCDRVIGCVENSNIICKSNVTAEDECCRDYYRNGPESCEPCIGSRGYNCSIPCEFGFFGHGCREKCNCTSDTPWCDAEVG